MDWMPADVMWKSRGQGRNWKSSHNNAGKLSQNSQEVRTYSEEVRKYNHTVYPKASWAGIVCHTHYSNTTTASDC